MANDLEVWLHGEHIGSLTASAGKLAFQYRASWLARAGAQPLSQSLPLQSAAYDDSACRPYFAGLLPEGELRGLLAKQLHVSRQNDFGLLRQIGGECAGAVSLRPSRTGKEQHSVDSAADSANQRADDGDIRWLSEDDVASILTLLPKRPMLAGQEGIRLSLAGAQDKLPIVFDGGRIGLPLNGSPSTHILKPAISGVDGSVANEAFCMTLAASAGLNVAPVSVRYAHGAAYLLVERYDRKTAHAGSANKIVRLHQEDFCQALGVPPELKYQNEGGPGLSACFELLRRVARPSAPHVLQLLDAVIFNALIGNHDAHAKNFSLLYQRDGSATLAPAYDMLCTAIYPSLSNKMAMKIGSKYQFDDVLARHWEQFANEAGLAKAQTRQRVLKIAAQLPVLADFLVADRSQGFRDDLNIKEIVALLKTRCTNVSARLTS